MARKGKVVIDKERCKGCYLCIRACPVGVLEKDTGPNSQGSYPSVPARPEKCIACGSCYLVCPDVCIAIYEREEAGA
ncbi:MAG: 4Fe-4S binding protein [Treponema sp.]|jgi:2-oxoglutarate ferredoxin oxidoreductase subunit delta|nr:4Fe-4S binding protein [Treponema sp.]